MSAKRAALAASQCLPNTHTSTAAGQEDDIAAACQEALGAGMLLQGAALAQQGSSHLATSLPLTHLACIPDAPASQRSVALVQLAVQLSQRHSFQSAEQASTHLTILSQSAIMHVGRAFLMAQPGSGKGNCAAKPAPQLPGC